MCTCDFDPSFSAKDWRLLFRCFAEEDYCVVYVCSSHCILTTTLLWWCSYCFVLLGFGEAFWAFSEFPYSKCFITGRRKTWIYEFGRQGQGKPCGRFGFPLKISLFQLSSTNSFPRNIHSHLHSHTRTNGVGVGGRYTFSCSSSSAIRTLLLRWFFADDDDAAAAAAPSIRWWWCWWLWYSCNSNTMTLPLPMMVPI